MKRIRLLLLAAAGVPLFVHAQSAGIPVPVADANAAAPALQYQSVFPAAQTGTEPPPSPDKVWRRANQDVTGGPGHNAHGAHGAHGAHEAAPAPASPASPAPPKGPAAQPAPDPHKGHHMNKKGH